MMKARFLLNILYCKAPGSRRDEFAQDAKRLGYKMFCFNGSVYSTSEYLNGSTVEIFNISDIEE